MFHKIYFLLFIALIGCSFGQEEMDEEVTPDQPTDNEEVTPDQPTDKEDFDILRNPVTRDILKKMVNTVKSIYQNKNTRETVNAIMKSRASVFGNEESRDIIGRAMDNFKTLFLDPKHLDNISKLIDMLQSVIMNDNTRQILEENMELVETALKRDPLIRNMFAMVSDLLANTDEKTGLLDLQILQEITKLISGDKLKNIAELATTLDNTIAIDPVVAPPQQQQQQQQQQRTPSIRRDRSIRIN